MVTVAQNYLQYDGWKNSKLTYLATHTEGGTARKVFCFAKAWVKAFWRLLLGRYDLVHLHVAERGSFYRKALLVRLCRRLNIPVILHHHGAEFEDFYSEMDVKQKAYVKRIFEAADCNLVFSGFLREKLLEKAPAAKVMVLYNAVKVPQKSQYCMAAQRIVMLGKQVERKGSFDLLEAAAIIDKKLPESIRLWMCGDGDIEGVRKKASELGISGRLAHVGWLDGAEKEACLAEAMVHVLPSYREGLPMSILETMGRGIPNISTRIAAIPEIICEGENGFLIEPGDVKRLAELLQQLAEDEELRGRIGQEGRRQVIENFSLEKNIAELEEIYERVRRDACG
ncbi:MAG: glycosyltransferase family 4 protein [Clostridium sp.]|nr:glycosyltransferase family 4 protein [Clostridium sp.]